MQGAGKNSLGVAGTGYELTNLQPGFAILTGMRLIITCFILACSGILPAFAQEEIPAPKPAKICTVDKVKLSTADMLAQINSQISDDKKTVAPQQVAVQAVAPAKVEEAKLVSEPPVKPVKALVKSPPVNPAKKAKPRKKKKAIQYDTLY